MPWYHTTYRANWVPTEEHEESSRIGAYGGYVWARTTTEARNIAKARGMGEKVDGECGKSLPYIPASKMLMKRHWKMSGALNVVHALCYLGQIALASGVATTQEVLGDQGFIHEYAHRVSRRALAKRVSEIERRVPGYLKTTPKRRKISKR